MTQRRDMPAQRGKVIVISGPSGAGKTSICDALLAADPNMVWSVSATTRPRRGDETSGRSYEFIDRSEFERRREAGEFLETAEYVGHLYGTPLRPVLDAIRAGHDVLMEIDVQGGYQVSRKMPESIRFFVLPPDMESLKARLAGRRTESAEQLQRRLAKADGEIGFARDCGCYQHFVVNDVLEETVQEIRDIVQKEKQRGEW
jgi:guanylate kinase